MEPKIFVGKDPLENNEKLTSAGVGSAQNWWFLNDVKHILKKIGNFFENIGEKIFRGRGNTLHLNLCLLPCCT